MSSRLGQAAIEYVTEYGWMLLAVAVVGTAVYSQLPESCRLEAQGFGENVQITQIGINRDQELFLALRKTTIDRVNVTQVRLNRSGNVIYSNQSLILETRRAKVVSLTEVERIEGCQEFRLAVVYNKGPVPAIEEFTTLNVPIKLAPASS